MKRRRLMSFEVEDASSDSYFNRKFSYSSCSREDSKNDNEDSILTLVIDEIQKVKAELNLAKNLLSSYDIIKWRNHTEFMHNGGEIIRHIKKYIKPELCTKAWCKFYEILSRFSSDLNFGNTFNSVHLCEAPGAFITSLNHFLKVNGYQGSWKWGASTLNPMYEGNDFGTMIDADNFIRETLDNWYFGFDNTGDIMVLENIEHIQMVCKESFKDGIDMVTCDGSIDCANEPEDQEKKVFSLQYCEVVSSLCILKEGGMMVLKMFTMFEAPATSLMFLISTLFKSLHVFKPVTSKPGNSEVYVVAMQFLGISDVFLQHLKDNIKTGRFKQDLEVFPLDSLPSSFLSEHAKCCQMFSTWQKETILENINSFGRDNRNITFVKKSFLDKFLSLYKLSKLEENLQVVPYRSTQQLIPEGQSKEAYVGRGHTGSLIQRKNTLTLSLLEKLRNMQMFDLENAESHLKFEHLELSCLNEDWKIIFGKLFDRIGSSRFCQRSLLQHYNECLRSELVSVSKKSLGDIEEDIFTRQVAELIQMHDLKVIHSTNDSIIHKLNFQSKSLDVKIVSGNFPTPCNHLRIESFIPIDANDATCTVLDQSGVVRFLDAVSMLEKGCHFLLPLGALLTRIAAQMFLILLSNFHQVSVFRYGQLPYMYVYADSCLGISSDIRTKLKEVCNSIEVADKAQGVLSFLPSDVSYDTSAIDTLQKINNNYLKMRINYFLTLLEGEGT